MQSEPEKSGISLIRVNNEREMQRYNVDAMAKDLFGSQAERLFPIYLVFYHGTLRGYFHAIQQLVIYPALHPGLDRMSPREFVKITRSLITELKRMNGNPLFMLCDRVAEEKNLHRYRIKKAPETAFIYDEDAR